MTKMALLPKILFLFSNVILKVPINLLNRMQGLINSFIWKDKRSQIRSQIVEPRIENRGLAIPNIKKYYYVAMPVASLDWWRFQIDGDILALEQAASEHSLIDWLVVTKKLVLPWRGISQTVRKVEKIWVEYQEDLIPAGSMLMTFAKHPGFF